MDNKKIGQKIASQRSKLNLTQTALAEKLCVSPKTVSKWESGNGLPSLEFLPVLSNILGITIDELLCKETENIKNVLEEMNAMAVFRMLSPNYVKFPEQVKDVLVEEWLTFILKNYDLSLSDFYAFVNAKSRPKNILDCADKILDMDSVSISGIQRKLKIGYSRAARIRDKLVENKFLDKETYEWIDKDYNNLCSLLTEELKGISFNDETLEDLDTSNKNYVSSIDFKAINIINDNLSDDEKLKLIELLEECSVDATHPISSAICCFERDKVENLLLTTNNCLNVEIFNIDSLDDFQNKVKIPKAEYALLIAESNNDTEVLELMSICDLKRNADISLKINNDLDTKFRLTVFYVKGN